MVREEDEQHWLIRQVRMRKGKEASTASTQREKVDQNPYVPKARKRRDLRLVGEGSQAHIDYSSQVVDLTQTYEYVEGFQGYDRMEEENMFYQPQEEEEAQDEEVADDEKVAGNIVPEREGEPETRRRRRLAPLIPPCPVVGPPFPVGPETTTLLSDYARHVAISLWVNHHNVSL